MQFIKTTLYRIYLLALIAVMIAYCHDNANLARGLFG